MVERTDRRTAESSRAGTVQSSLLTQGTHGQCDMGTVPTCTVSFRRSDPTPRPRDLGKWFRPKVFVKCHRWVNSCTTNGTGAQSKRSNEAFYSTISTVFLAPSEECTSPTPLPVERGSRSSCWWWGVRAPLMWLPWERSNGREHGRGAMRGHRGGKAGSPRCRPWARARRGMRE